MLRSLKRRLVPCSMDRAEHRIAVEDGIKLVAMLRSCGFDVAGKIGLEIGTGWVPTIPIILWLCGAERLYLTDVARYLDQQTLNLARQNLRLHADLVEHELGIPRSVVEEKLSRATALSHFGFEYLAPIKWDALSSADIDYVISRAVLEHIPSRDIPKILVEISHVLKPGGLLANIIDNSDHFQHQDSSISRLNFLQFSDTTWGLICSLTDQQNRLRHSDYRKIFSSSGFQILYERRYVDPGTLSTLDQLKIQPKFRTYDREDLATLTSYFVLRKPA